MKEREEIQIADTLLASHFSLLQKNTAEYGRVALRSMLCLFVLPHRFSYLLLPLS